MRSPSRGSRSTSSLTRTSMAGHPIRCAAVIAASATSTPKSCSVTGKRFRPIVPRVSGGSPPYSRCGGCAQIGCVRTPHNRSFLATIYACGLRLQEAQHRDVSDVDSKRSYCTSAAARAPWTASCAWRLPPWQVCTSTGAPTAIPCSSSPLWAQGATGPRRVIPPNAQSRSAGRLSSGQA